MKNSRDAVAMPPFGAVVAVDDLSLYVHGPGMCVSERCAIHNPTHHMGNWPIVLRMDYPWPMVERTCEHGVGHPDPDSVWWYESQTGEEWLDMHGCDGCCRREDE